MPYNEDDYLQLSGLQHFAFCRRQWALIHIEKQWAENFLTADGTLMHANAHNKGFRERRGDLLTIRGLAIHSVELGISGECDVVEFRQDPNGVQLAGQEGLWQPLPVEYKRGRPGGHTYADSLQLCAQALCLEEMLCCSVTQGALYYGDTRHRELVKLDEVLREDVRKMLAEMHQLFHRGTTPKVKPSKSCSSCSIHNLCLPRLNQSKSASAYLREHMGEK